MLCLTAPSDPQPSAPPVENDDDALVDQYKHVLAEAPHPPAVEPQLDVAPPQYDEAKLPAYEEAAAI